VLCGFSRANSWGETREKPQYAVSSVRQAAHEGPTDRPEGRRRSPISGCRAAGGPRPPSSGLEQGCCSAQSWSASRALARRRPHLGVPARRGLHADGARRQRDASVRRKEHGDRTVLQLLEVVRRRLNPGGQGGHSAQARVGKTRGRESGVVLGRSRRRRRGLGTRHTREVGRASRLRGQDGAALAASPASPLRPRESVSPGEHGPLLGHLVDRTPS
jgi:hypothetical protein